MEQTVLITGASRGIGRAIAHAFAGAGYQKIVINCIHSEALLDSLRRELEAAYSCRVLSCVGDVGDSTYVEQLFAEIDARFGGVDVLVNNAGISHIGLLQDMSVDDWDNIVRTNLTSTFLTCKYAIPHMLSAQAGCIINISSVWGNIGASCEVAYSATKGGVNTFTKALAKELAPSHVKVNAIACGVIDTEMNACFSDEERKCLQDEIPCGRFGTPKEVASVALQLAGTTSYLTGQIITLDGGWS
jgi:3-oxoacyl-[acyl-carrier protein] reductase